MFGGLNLPSKIKVFVWRACHHQWLPSTVNLARRKVPIDGLFPVCSKSFETTIHAMALSVMILILWCLGVVDSWPILIQLIFMLIATWGRFLNSLLSGNR
ncbi:hypothetical protein QYF36_015362 [Acer negundo]|nr:hypothetical protein QYF36_015362 [Acer negundo]